MLSYRCYTWIFLALEPFWLIYFLWKIVFCYKLVVDYFYLDWFLMSLFLINLWGSLNSKLIFKNINILVQFLAGVYSQKVESKLKLQYLEKFLMTDHVKFWVLYGLLDTIRMYIIQMYINFDRNQLNASFIIPIFLKKKWENFMLAPLFLFRQFLSFMRASQDSICGKTLKFFACRISLRREVLGILFFLTIFYRTISGNLD